MSRAPKPIVHGTDAGYRKGCRLDCCRNAHTKAQQVYRANKRAAALAAASEEPLFDAPLTPAQTDVPEPEDLPPGPIELALQQEFVGLDPIVSFPKTLMQIALFNARVLDQTRVHTRYDIISGIESRTFEALARLRSINPVPSGGADEDDDAAKVLLTKLEQA